METSDLPSDANATKATIDMNCLTESKSVKRRSCQPLRSHRVKHRLRIHTGISHSRYRLRRVRWQEQNDEQNENLSVLHDLEAHRPNGN